MNEYTGKELAIEVAKKLGENLQRELSPFSIGYSNAFNKYLHNKAAEILFSEGMAGKIRQHLFMSYQRRPDLADDHIGQLEEFEYWFDELSPEKILNIWLQL